MPTFDIEVSRDGRWWMIQVPALAGFVHPDGSVNCSTFTQAETEDEIEHMARDFIAVTLGVPYESVQVRSAV